MKISKLFFPSFCLIILIGCSVFAQDKTNVQNNAPGGDGGSTCSCSDPTAKCTASVSCPSGNAVCVCSDAGCTAYCVGGFAGEFPDIKILLVKLQSAEEVEIGDILGKAFGKTVIFTPYREKFSFDYIAQTANYWDVLEYLAQNGELKINGGDYRMWKKIREIVTSGKANFCTGNASLGSFVNELSFFAGKKYQIIGGNPSSRMNMDIKGLNIDGIMAALEKHYQITIQQ